MRARPLVSVVMPFRDAGAHIAEAIDSVIAQTYPHWELLLVDDGSSDDGPSIAARYVSKDPGRIGLVPQSGAGVSDARNAAIASARGELIAFLDSDDVWLPTKLAEQVAILEQNPTAGALYGNTLFWHSWAGDRPDDVPQLGVPTGKTIEPPLLLGLMLRGRAAVPSMCSIIVRRECIDRAGGFESEFRRIFSDQAFYTKLLLDTPVYVSDRIWDKYRQHPGSSCAQVEREGRLREARAMFHGWAATYLAERAPAGSPVHSALARAGWGDAHPRADHVLRLLRRGTRKVRGRVVPLARRVAPGLLRGAAAATGRRLPVGTVRLGDLRRTTPISNRFGFDRGTPIDRRYIEAFLAAHAGDIRGRALEVGDAAYTTRFGGGRPTRIDVLHVHDTPEATIVGDLSNAPHIGDGQFDCIVLTQTLHLIYDMESAMRTLHRILAPGGVLLLTTPGISPVDSGAWRDTWCWSLTAFSLRRLAETCFPADHVDVESRGNVLAACGFLQGLAAEELEERELAVHDESYPVIVTLRAQKPAAS